MAGKPTGCISQTRLFTTSWILALSLNRRKKLWIESIQNITVQLKYENAPQAIPNYLFIFHDLSVSTTRKIDLDSCSCAPWENKIICKKAYYIKSFCWCSRHKIINKCRCDQNFSLSDIQSKKGKKPYSCFCQHKPHPIWNVRVYPSKNQLWFTYQKMKQISIIVANGYPKCRLVFYKRPENPERITWPKSFNSVNQ